jgi:hypothetical protein
LGTNTYKWQNAYIGAVLTNFITDAGTGTNYFGTLGYVTVQDNLYPDGNGSYDLGSMTEHWNNVYALNTYTTGVIFSDDTSIQISAACCTVVSYGSPSWLGTPTSTRTLPTVPGTIYQNLTGKSIIVTVVGYSSVWPATLVAEMGPTSATYITMCEQGYANVETTCSFTVPAPYYYQVYLTTAGVTGLSSWVEEK